MELEITYWSNGNKHIERYFVNGKFHRLDGPAYIVYYENGTIWHEKYYENGKRHRLDGPAFIEYYDNEINAYQSYFVNGKIIPKKEIDNILEQCDNDKDLLKDILTIRYI